MVNYVNLGIFISKQFRLGHYDTGSPNHTLYTSLARLVESISRASLTELNVPGSMSDIHWQNSAVIAYVMLLVVLFEIPGHTVTEAVI